MGMSTHLYAIIGDRTVSVHRRVVPNYSLLDLGFGEVLYELRVDGEIADSHKHGALGGGGSMFATIEEVRNEDISPCRRSAGHLRNEVQTPG